MEYDVVDALKDLGYVEESLNADTLSELSKETVRSVFVRKIIVWLSEQLTSLLQLDSTVSKITQDEDIPGFTMELGSLLKELQCPYTDLSEGPLTDRIASKEQCLRLLLFLASEVMAARMIRTDRPNNVVNIHESATARDLKSILLALKFGKPPDNITAKELFPKVEAKLRGTVSSAPPALSGKPLLAGRLSTDQWDTLKKIQSELNEEYRLRRDMLLKRLDVTVQSFEWSEQAKGKQNDIADSFMERRRQMTAEPGVSLADILAARQDAAVIEKTSGSTARKNTTSSVHKVIIGRVPDRGGRTEEQEAPPPEMPSWQKDRAQGGGGRGGNFSQGGGGGGRGGGFSSRGGGRVQGGWNQRDGQDRSDARNDRKENDRGDRGYGGGRGRGGYSQR